MAEQASLEEARRHLQAVSPSEPAAGGAGAGGVGRPADSPQKERLTLVIEQLPHAAYMVNHKFEVTWFNQQARLEIPGLLGEMPPHTDDRSIFRLLLDDSRGEVSENLLSMLRLNLMLAKERMSINSILAPLRGLPGSRLQLLEET
ncbi:MAG: hypothetical protein FJY56_07635 [Betaproteobacteria bacterium]|nr:hypothetical protein [Betaproteobacteria bacterium]